MVKNAAGDFLFTKAIAWGVVTSVYFTYEVGPGGPQRNTAATPHSYTVGTVCTVSSSNVPPTVSLTAPAANAVFAAPAALTLTANAADADGTVAKVEFYQGNTLLATDFTAPYSYTWAGAPARSPTLFEVSTALVPTPGHERVDTVVVEHRREACVVTEFFVDRLREVAVVERFVAAEFAQRPVEQVVRVRFGCTIAGCERIGQRSPAPLLGLAVALLPDQRTRTRDREPRPLHRDGGVTGQRCQRGEPTPIPPDRGRMLAELFAQRPLLPAQTRM